MFAVIFVTAAVAIIFVHDRWKTWRRETPLRRAATGGGHSGDAEAPSGAFAPTGSAEGRSRPALIRIRARISTLVRGLLFTVVLVGTEARLESVRWWCSPTVVSALRLTAEQSAAIDRLYQDSLLAQRHGSEDVFGLTGQIAKRMEAGDYDDDTLRLTERLAKAQSAQREVRRQMLELAVGALSPQQRETLSRLVGEKHVVR